jgi:hypothetical protein
MQLSELLKQAWQQLPVVKSGQTQHQIIIKPTVSAVLSTADLFCFGLTHFKSRRHDCNTQTFSERATHASTSSAQVCRPYESCSP